MYVVFLGYVYLAFCVMRWLGCFFDWLHDDVDCTENHVHMHVRNVVLPHLYCSNEVCFVLVQFFVSDCSMAVHSGSAHIASTAAHGERKRALPNPPLPVAKKTIVACNGSTVDRGCFHCARSARLELCCMCGESGCRSCNNWCSRKVDGCGVIVCGTCNAGSNVIIERRRGEWLCTNCVPLKKLR